MAMLEVTHDLCLLPSEGNKVWIMDLLVTLIAMHTAFHSL